MSSLKLEQISNGNDRLSSREFRYLSKLSSNPDLLNRFDKKQLSNLKDLLEKQMEGYLKRSKNEISKKEVKKYTDIIVNKINSIIGNEIDNNSEQEEKGKFGLSEKELKNNNLSKEIEKVLEDGKITKEEAIFLKDLFMDKINNPYDVSYKQLKRFRKLIHSKSRRGWITDQDLRKLDGYIDKLQVQESKQAEKKTEHVEKKPEQTRDNSEQAKKASYEKKDDKEKKGGKKLPVGENNNTENIDTIPDVNILEKLLKKSVIRDKVEKKIYLAYENNENFVKLRYNHKIHKISVDSVAKLLGIDKKSFLKEKHKTRELHVENRETYKELSEINKLYEQYEKLVQNNKVIGMSDRYRKLYIKETKQLEHKTLPFGSKEIINKFNDVDLQDVFKDRSLRELKTKWMIEKNWDKIKVLMLGGLVRALKNVKSKRGNIDVRNHPIVINVPVEKKINGVYHNASLSFVYDPKHPNKIDIDVFSYGFRKRMEKKGGSNKYIWSNINDTHTSELGTSLLNLRSSIYKFGKQINGSKYHFKIYPTGLDRTNYNMHGRKLRVHGVSDFRSKMIRKGKGNAFMASRGCIVYGDNSVGKMFSRNKNKKYAIMEITYPVY